MGEFSQEPFCYLSAQNHGREIETETGGVGEW